MTSRADKIPAALFDFDGTITRADTLAPLLLFLFRRHPESLKEFPRLAALAPLYGAGLISKEQMKAQVLRAFARIPEDEREQVIERFCAQELRPRYLKGALKRLDWHRSQGHRLLLVSASMELYLERVVQDLEMDALIATRTELDGGPTAEGDKPLDGLLRKALSAGTPRLEGPNCYGEEKVKRLQAWDGFDDTDWPASWAYSDHISDLPMLMLCGHPVAARPERKLQRHALRQGWRIMRWS